MNPALIWPPTLLLTATQFLTFTIGNVVTVTILVGAGVAGYYRLRAVKHDELEAAAAFWREQAEGLTEVTDEQRKRIEEVTAERERERSLKHEALNVLAAERLKTDLSSVVKQLAESQTLIVARVEASEKANREGTAAVLQALESRMEARFDAFLSNQAAMIESLHGLASAVEKLNGGTAVRERKPQT